MWPRRRRKAVSAGQLYQMTQMFYEAWLPCSTSFVNVVAGDQLTTVARCREPVTVRLHVHCSSCTYESRNFYCDTCVAKVHSGQMSCAKCMSPLQFIAAI